MNIEAERILKLADAADAAKRIDRDTAIELLIMAVREIVAFVDAREEREWESNMGDDL